LFLVKLVPKQRKTAKKIYSMN